MMPVFTKFCNAVLFLFVLSVLVQCGSNENLTKDDARDYIEDYLVEYPVYATGKFKTERMKLNMTDDADLVNEIKALERDGYIEVNEVKKRKQWLGKDSIWIISPTLTQKSLPYVIEKKKNYTKVKTATYEVSDQEIVLDKRNKRKSKASVVLIQKPTPFASFGDGRELKDHFITETFTLKFDENTGWVVTK